MEAKGNKRWYYLAIGTLMMVFLGLIYAWSIFVAPLEAEFGWSRADTSFTFTVSISFFVIGLIANGFLLQRLPPRTILWIAAGLFVAGFFFCSRVSAPYHLYLAYGVLVGFPVGLVNNTLVSTIVKWFPGKTGIASGILMMGFGVGGMVLGSLATALMEAFGWRRTFLLFGIAFAVIMVLGSLVVKLPPQGFAASGAARKQENPDMSPKQVVTRPSFWLYILWFVLCCAGGLLVIGHAKTVATELGASESTGVLFTGAVSFANGGGRILCGVVYDKVGLRKSMLLTTLYIIASGALLLLASATSLLPVLLLGFLFAGLSYGGLPTTSSTYASSFYGMKHFSINYGLVSAGMIPGALAGPYLAGVLFTVSGGYQSSFAMMLAFGVVALVFSRLIRKP